MNKDWLKTIALIGILIIGIVIGFGYGYNIILPNNITIGLDQATQETIQLMENVSNNMQEVCESMKPTCICNCSS